MFNKKGRKRTVLCLRCNMVYAIKKKKYICEECLPNRSEQRKSIKRAIQEICPEETSKKTIYTNGSETEENVLQKDIEITNKLQLELCAYRYDQLYNQLLTIPRDEIPNQVASIEKILIDKWDVPVKVVSQAKNDYLLKQTRKLL